MTMEPEPNYAENPSHLIGKTVLVGITVQSAGGELLGREQFFGSVISADPESGIDLRATDGSIEWIPPAFEHLEPAKPGEYELTVTGEVVMDPDLIATFVVTQPAEE